MEEAEKLANAHWDYVSELLDAHGVNSNSVEMVGFHYKTAFIHGYKHGYHEAEKEKGKG